jgi:hypothetical protein
MSTKVCAALHFPPSIAVSYAYYTGRQWKIMYSMAIRFMAVNIAETAWRLYVYLILLDAMRTSMKEMLNLIGR